MPTLTEMLVSAELVIDWLCDEESVVPLVVAFETEKGHGVLELHFVIAVIAPWMPGVLCGVLFVTLTTLHWLGSKLLSRATATLLTDLTTADRTGCSSRFVAEERLMECSLGSRL